MKQNMILIGFMGAGKTTVGKALAERCGMPLLDTDQLITEKAGMAIPEIFDHCGEDGFRRIESEVLTELLEHTDHTVISVGGGLPLREENRAVLSQLGTVVYLDVSEETVWNRLKDETDRPLLQVENVSEKIREMLIYRRPVYEQAAHFKVCVDGKSPKQIAAELAEKAGEKR